MSDNLNTTSQTGRLDQTEGDIPTERQGQMYTGLGEQEVTEPRSGQAGREASGGGKPSMMEKMRGKAEKVAEKTHLKKPEHETGQETARQTGQSGGQWHA